MTRYFQLIVLLLSTFLKLSAQVNYSDSSSSAGYMISPIFFYPANVESNIVRPVECSNWSEEIILNGLIINHEVFIDLGLKEKYLVKTVDRRTLENIFLKKYNKYKDGVYWYQFATNSTGRCLEKTIFSFNIRLPFKLNGELLDEGEVNFKLKEIDLKDLISIKRHRRFLGAGRIEVLVK